MRITWKKLLICLVFLAAVLSALLFMEPLWRGFRLRNTILTAIESASTVRVVEHSNEFDNLLSEEPYKEKIYLSRTLQPDEIKALKKALALSADYSGSIVTMCAFSDHHRIEAEQPDGTIFRLKICFACEELVVNESAKRMFPVRWNKSLRAFFTQMGMSPDGPWKVDRGPSDS